MSRLESASCIDRESATQQALRIPHFSNRGARAHEHDTLLLHYD
jgi:hypothetical protein